MVTQTNNMDKPKVLIGIPAYNEGSNIKNLLTDLVAQDISTFELINIVVLSDGSTDNTVAQAQSVSNDKIIVVDNKENKGLAARSNELMHYKNADIVLLLNGDIRITDNKCLQKMIKPISEDHADLVSCRLLESKPRTFIEKVLAIGNEIKRETFEDLNDGDNWYNCHGTIRALSKAFVLKFEFKKSFAEDMYSYIFCHANGFKFSFVKDTECWYALPATLYDHLKQEIRFYNSNKIFYDDLPKQLIHRLTKWPWVKLAISGIKVFLKSPIYSTIYPFLVLYCYLYSAIKPEKINKDTWTLANSSKTVNI